MWESERRYMEMKYKQMMSNVEEGLGATEEEMCSKL